jgi:L-iditol 2-dehydrogenase
MNRVARLYSWGNVRIEEQPMPEPGPGEIVVRIEACGLCGSDALTWYVEKKAPAVLGHEPVGVVSAVGRDVADLEVGDRVFVHHHAPCMSCENCRRRLWASCEVWRKNALDPGGFAQYTLVRAQTVARDTLAIPQNMTAEVATFIEPLACCIRAVQRHGSVQSGDVVYVVGLGAMGLLMTQLATLYGAPLVVGADFVAERRDQALKMGAHIAIDPRDASQVQQWRERAGHRGADVVMVCPGDARAVNAGIAAAAPGARVVCFTPTPPDQPMPIDMSTLYFKEISLHQSYSCGPDETRAALELLANGRVQVEALITHRAGLSGVADALERAHDASEGYKTVIFPWND